MQFHQFVVCIMHAVMRFIVRHRAQSGEWGAARLSHWHRSAVLSVGRDDGILYFNHNMETTYGTVSKSAVDTSRLNFRDPISHVGWAAKVGVQ